MNGELAPEGMNDLLLSFAGQRIVSAAVRTGIWPAISQKPQDAKALALTLGLDEGATGKILRSLAALGLVQADDSHRYQPQSHSQGLFDSLLPPRLQKESDQDSNQDPWSVMLESWVRTGQAPQQKRSSEQEQELAEAMQANAELLAPLVVGHLPLSEVQRVLDVGGGLGAYAVELCRAKPELTVTVLERPEIVQLGPKAIASTGVCERIEFLAADFNAEGSWGQGYDLVLLANVLHQELTNKAKTLLLRSASKLAVGGRLAVVEFDIDDQYRADRMGCLFAINLRSFGDAYTQATLHQWMAHAGLGNLQSHELPPSHHLLVGQRLG